MAENEQAAQAQQVEVTETEDDVVLDPEQSQQIIVQEETEVVETVETKQIECQQDEVQPDEPQPDEPQPEPQPDEPLLENNVDNDDSIRDKDGMESHENPFVAGGELDQKAEFILRHSTISRTQLEIADPDRYKETRDEIPIEQIQKTEAVPVAGAPPDQMNGKVEEPVSPQKVEVNMAKANASQPETQQPEQVKPKDGKCKCCVIQ